MGSETQATTEEPNDDKDQATTWSPEPATLRDGETTDESSHAARNAAMLRMWADERDQGEDQ